MRVAQWRNVWQLAGLEIPAPSRASLNALYKTDSCKWCLRFSPVDKRRWQVSGPPCSLRSRVNLRGLNADQRSPNSFCTSLRMVKSAISLSGISRVIFTSFFAWSISKFRPSAGMPPSWLITFTVAS